MINKEEISSIIVLGETGTGKSSFCNNLCLQPKCKIGEGLNSETERVNGINCEGIYSDIFIIDTPGLNDSNGPEQDERNIELMNDFIKKNPRIKGIIILLKFTDNRLTGSVKKSLKTFCNMLPMNNFWNHVIIVLSHFYANNYEEKQARKEALIKHYKQEFNIIMNKSKNEHPNFILPSSINIYFCELKNPDQETKNTISNAIEYLRSKEKMYKKIEERIENPKIIKTTKLGNTTTIEYIIEKIITFTDFDNTQTESKKIIDNWKETDIQEVETEVNVINEGEKKIYEHFSYNKIIHKNRNGEENISIDKEKPIEKYVESEEMIYLPEEVSDKVEGNLTISTHKFYKQLKYVDRNLKETFGEKILYNSYITKKEIVEETPLINNEGNTQIIRYRRKNKYTDKDGNITYGEPEIYKTDTQITRVEIVYRDDSDDDCLIY